MCSAVVQITAPAPNFTEPLLFCLYVEVTLWELVLSAWQDAGEVRRQLSSGHAAGAPPVCQAWQQGALGGEATASSCAARPLSPGQCTYV